MYLHKQTHTHSAQRTVWGINSRLVLKRIVADYRVNKGHKTALMALDGLCQALNLTAHQIQVIRALFVYINRVETDLFPARSLTRSTYDGDCRDSRSYV